jgi:hypothetical protein
MACPSQPPCRFDTKVESQIQHSEKTADSVNPENALNHMPEMSRVLKNTVVTAQFAGGLRIYSIHDPQEPKEIAYFAPNVPGNKGGAIQMNDLIVGNDDLIYANDRFTGGLYILKYTGKTPLN